MTIEHQPKRVAKSRARRTAARNSSAQNAGSVPRILTIGHSTRPIEEFIELLRAHAVTCLVDVRTVPRSRHNPLYNRDELALSLKPAGITYLHCPALGGLRKTSTKSINTGWRNTSFRGYADYMQTEEFRCAVDHLIELAVHDRLALMCAEAVPWRCHRSLIADALLVRGMATEDIRSTTQRMPHRLTPFARVRGTRIVYPPQKSALSGVLPDAGQDLPGHSIHE
jgi:uncharacterized protein (DUF488 family)